MTRLLTATLLLSLLISSSVLCRAELTTLPSSRFDEYGAISWENEKGRLDSFAIALHNSEKFFGYILVFDATDGCPGEATARAVRAKRYLVEHRGVPWNRVLWRREGYQKWITTSLVMVPVGMTLRYPWFDSTLAPRDGPATRACEARLLKIRRSQW